MAIKGTTIGTTLHSNNVSNCTIKIAATHLSAHGKELKSFSRNKKLELIKEQNPKLDFIKV